MPIEVPKTDFVAQKTILREFCSRYAFPKEAEASLSEDLRVLWNHPSAAEFFRQRLSAYRGPGTLNHGETLDLLRKEAEDCGVSPYAAHLLFYILLSPSLFRVYAERGYPSDLFDDAMEDLRCKLLECHTVYGVWGSFVAIWFARFFECTLFGIGRLEFAPKHFGSVFSDGEHTLSENSFVIDVHIPSKGRLPYEAVQDAYGRAILFFRTAFPQYAPQNWQPVFFCESWMLFPQHEAILSQKENRNLLRFQRDYTITRQGPDPDGSDLWRIFGCEVDPENVVALQMLPEQTSLQRAYKRFLLEGGVPGWGEGVFFWNSGTKCESEERP